MLTQLDTLIGFVVVMALVSLLVTIITQMASSLLGLRGKCLAEALEAMIFKIEPKIEKAVCLKLVDRLLTHPAISDSVLSMNQPVLLFWKWNPGWWRWLVGQWRRASAIRPDELLALLEEFAENQAPMAGAVLSAAAKTVDDVERSCAEIERNTAALNTSAESLKSLQTARAALEAARLKHAALRILDRLQVVSEESRQGLQSLRNAMPKLAEQKGAAAIKELNAAANHALNNLTTWFNSTQDRASQWFTLHTRAIAIVGALVLAFVLQLDTVELLQQVSSDRELRDSLVKTGAAGGLLNAGNQVLTKGFGLATGTNDLPYQQNLAILTNALHAVVQTSARDGLQLVPEPYPIQFAGWKWHCLPWFKLIAPWSWPLRHLFGIILSAGLLSLGAPFWFNLLKSLANLRPSLANEIDNDAKPS